MTEIGKTAIALLQDVTNRDLRSMSQYDEESIRAVVAEIEQHVERTGVITRNIEEIERQANPDTPADQRFINWGNYPGDALAMVVHCESIKRNKRLLLTYMTERVERIKYVRWRSKLLPQKIKELLSPGELEFFEEYDQVLSRYMATCLGGSYFDLTLDVLPPKSPFLSIRVLQDQGEVMFSFGRLHLRKGTVHSIPADEAEPLIREGFVECLNTTS